MIQEQLFEWAKDHHARKSDPDTSWIAQALLDEGKIQAMLRMDLIVHGRFPEGLTDEECEVQLRIFWPDLIIHDRNHSKRCSDLEGSGYIEDSGLRRINSTGRPAKVRKITFKGLVALKYKHTIGRNEKDSI